MEVSVVRLRSILSAPDATVLARIWRINIGSGTDERIICLKTPTNRVLVVKPTSERSFAMIVASADNVQNGLIE